LTLRRNRISVVIHVRVSCVVWPAADSTAVTFPGGVVWLRMGVFPGQVAR
jgi:hypothetical protein